MLARAGAVLAASLHLERVASGSLAACSASPAARLWGATRHFSAAAPAVQQAEEEPLTIDTSAVARLKELQGQHGKGVALRIEVEGGGCSGFTYKFSLTSLDQLGKEDRVIERDGGKVVCDNVSLEFIRGAKIEFEDNLMRSAFVVSSNPNSEASCGCGSSFAAKMK